MVEDNGTHNECNLPVPGWDLKHNEGQQVQYECQQCQKVDTNVSARNETYYHKPNLH